MGVMDKVSTQRQNGGGKRPGAGRPKGALNKDRDELMALVKQAVKAVYNLDYDPVISMALRANDPKISETVRQRADEEVASYTHSKRKAIEITGNMNTNTMVVFGWLDPDEDEPSSE